MRLRSPQFQKVKIPPSGSQDLLMLFSLFGERAPGMVGDIEGLLVFNLPKISGTLKTFFHVA
jgi:hypothetical protein